MLIVRYLVYAYHHPLHFLTDFPSILEILKLYGMKILNVLFVAVLLILTHITAIAQSCVLSCPSNMVIRADNGREGAIVNMVAAGMVGDCGTVTQFPASGTFFRIGSHSVISTTSSGQKCSFTVTVTDNESPVLSPLTLSLKRLWPASNKMRTVEVYYTTSDNAGDVTSVVSVSSNEVTSNTNDWEIIDNHSIRLKQSRLASGEPRIYSIVVTSSDEAGNKTTRTTSIAVSKTMISF